MAMEILLRDVIESDLAIFFMQQLDPEANYMAAFTSKDPADYDAFMAHWRRILADSSVKIKTIVVDGEIAGSILSYEEEGRTEVSYWLGKEFWGKGIATWALAEFVTRVNPVRPVYARAAKDHIGSRRVLEKCGFTIVGEDRGFANARGEEVEEYLLCLCA